ncbi:ATP-dependent DNA helicase pfh1 [Lucilia cuprina]|nr:ATP-dependent DNA helicase pfh1 [Lucilia cuprina]
MLNVKQREYLHHLLRNVLDDVKFHEFISGGAGVVSNPNLVKVLLCAPTGKAAFGIGGATLHAMFSLPINQFSGEIRPLSNDVVNSLIPKLMILKIMIIGKISMVGSKMLGYLDARLKQIFKSTAAFGGISILVFGDLKQLSPVGDRCVFSTNPSHPYAVLAGESLWDLFKYYELTEIMRQRDDLSFAQALNSMAIGEMDTTQIELIKSRVVENASILPSEAIDLFWSNAEADQYNLLRLGQISTNEFTSKSFDVIKSDILATSNRSRILNMVLKMKTSETQGLPGELKLKTTKYMMTVNINTSDGLVNGAVGILMNIELNNQTGNPTSKNTSS